MSGDEKKPTVSLPRSEIDSGLIRNLERAVSGGFEKINARLDAQDAQLEIGVREGQRTNSRLTILEGRLEDVEVRIGRTSTRVKESSSADLEHSAQLAAEIQARQALAAEVAELAKVNATQMQVLARLDGLFKNPTFKLIAFAIWTTVTGWLTARGFSIPK
jgi:hypothetical protein